MKLKNYNCNASYAKHCTNQLEHAIDLKSKALFSAGPLAKTVSYQEKLAGFRLRRELGVEGLLIFKSASLEVVLAKSPRVVPTGYVGGKDGVTFGSDFDKGRVVNTDLTDRSPASFERAEWVGDSNPAMIKFHSWSDKHHVGQKNQQQSPWDGSVGSIDAGAGNTKSNCNSDRGCEVGPSQSWSDDVILTHHTILAVTMKAEE